MEDKTMRHMWNGGNSNTSDNRMPRKHRINNSNTTKANSTVQEESIREYPIYENKILKFVEGT